MEIEKRDFLKELERRMLSAYKLWVESSVAVEIARKRGDSRKKIPELILLLNSSRKDYHAAVELIEEQKREKKEVSDGP